jgi:hypothetical protein
MATTCYTSDAGGRVYGEVSYDPYLPVVRFRGFLTEGGAYRAEFTKGELK